MEQRYHLLTSIPRPLCRAIRPCPNTDSPIYQLLQFSFEDNPYCALAFDHALLGRDLLYKISPRTAVCEVHIQNRDSGDNTDIRLFGMDKNFALEKERFNFICH